MTDKRAQNIKQFLSELSGKAFAYLFPGVDKETIGERSYTYTYLTEEYPPVMACRSEYLDIGEADIYDAEPDSHREAVHQQSKRAKSTIVHFRRMYDMPSYDLYEDLKPESQIEEPAVQDLEPDEQTRALLAEIEKLQRKYGITIEELEAVIAFRVKLSRLHITEKKSIVLEDFDRKEVKMDTLTKAVFLLYLKHPEGIRYKELSDYQQELEKIYSSITGREDLDSIRKSVADLCDPLNNSINEKVSKVKKAFRDAVDDRVARFYYIDGKKGTAKRIALDRDFVLWG